MYSLNQDYFGLSDFLRNDQTYPREEAIYPGLKPFNPTDTTSECILKPFSPTATGEDMLLQQDSELESKFKKMTVAEIMIVQFVPVFPVDEAHVQQDCNAFSCQRSPVDQSFAENIYEYQSPSAVKTMNTSRAGMKETTNRFHSSARSSYRSSHTGKGLSNITSSEVTTTGSRKGFSSRTGSRSSWFRRQPEGCGFCRRNGERESFVQAHELKDEAGNVSCPILRNYTCPQCKATGDNAHTVAYCPLGRDRAPITSIKSTRKSCGCRWTGKHDHCT